MGIRIHKCLGYGFNDIETEDHEIVESRFNLTTNKELHEAFEEFEDRFWEAESIQYFGKYINLDDVFYNSETPASVLDVHKLGLEKGTPKTQYVFDAEFGDPNTILFVPIGCQHWARYDDNIDHYQSFLLDERKKAVVSKIPVKYGGISPYTHRFYRIKNHDYSHEGGDSHLLGSGYLGSRRYLSMIGELRDQMEPLVKEPLLTHLKEDWNFQIPLILRLALVYADVFSDPSISKRMEPIMYEYWS